MSKKIEFDEVCTSCDGTGIYVGFAEGDGAGVVCHHCKGTGCHHFKHEYTPFEMRKIKKDIKRVFATNCGIGVGTGESKGEKKYDLEDFGGMPYFDWLDGKPFPEKSEMRNFTCPACWYQSQDYDLSREIINKHCHPKGFGCGSFSGCVMHEQKSICWEVFDRDIKGK